MPYIKPRHREQLDNSPVTTPGELNYKISRLLDDYIFDQHKIADRFGYDVLNECIGVLECAKLEMYRRLAAPYEDVKRSENGDVYSLKTVDLAHNMETQ